MYSLCILGAGLHGSSIFTNLPSSLRAKTVVIDTNEQALHIFKQYYKRLKFERLRSPGTHSLSLDRRSLLTFAKAYNYNEAPFEGRYMLPLTKMFLDHSSQLLEKGKIHRNWLQEKITYISPYSSNKPYFSLYSSGKKLVCEAKKIILALGNDSFSIPKSDNLLSKQHILDPHYKTTNLSYNDTLTIIGGGMSAFQAAIAYAPCAHVQLITKKEPIITNFDSNPSFIGPRGLVPYRSSSNYTTKKNILIDARYRGSINSLLKKQFDSLVANKKIDIIFDSVEFIQKNQSKSGSQPDYQLSLVSGPQIAVKHLLLATGFAKNEVPHRTLVHSIAESCGFPLYYDGYPVVDKSLSWGENMYVTGKLAESYLGPAALNLIGAHLAYKILAPHLVNE